jgi:acetoin utilization deacetylase AcuC-like enzyme
MATGFHWNELYAWHDTGTGSGFLGAGGLVQPERHAENPETKRRFRNLLEVTGLLGRTVEIVGREATTAELLRVHSGEYLERIAALSAAGGGNAGESTPFGPDGYRIAALSAGGAIATIEAVCGGEVDNAYSLGRPPGHHAERDEGRGFCIFANVAVAVEHARAELGVERVAILDWDVHHGNGTEHIFYEDPNVLAISIHQDGLYPADSGRIGDTGAGPGSGSTINVPLPPGSGDATYVATLERVVLPAVEAFRPDLIVIASGLDASLMDPMSMMMVSSEGYRRMTDLMMELADRVCGGRLAIIHEGGYSTSYVPFCGAAVVEGLLRSEARVEDPFIWGFGGMGYTELLAHQEQVIDDVVTLHRLGSG